MTRSPGIAGLNDKLQDAAPRARVTLAALVELLGRDAPLRRELYSAVERSAGFMFWPRLIPRPELVARDAPRRAPTLSEPPARPSGPTAPERVPQSAPGAARMQHAAAAPVPTALAPLAPRRGALPRRAAGATPPSAAAPVRTAAELEVELQVALREKGQR